MLYVGYSSRKVQFALEELLNCAQLFMRFYKVFPFDAVREAIRRERNCLFRVLHYLLEILGVAPSLENVVTRQHPSHDARDVLGDELVLKPRWVECDLFPSYAFYLNGKP